MSFKRLVALMVVCMMLLVLVASVVMAQAPAQGQRQGQQAAPAQAAPARTPAAKAGTVTFNTVISKLKAGQHVFCQSITSPDTAQVRRWCQSTPQPDYIWIEMQHSRMDWETVDQMIRICAQEKVPPIVRVPQSFTADDIQRAADGGALGIILPMVETIEQVQKAVMYFKNPIMDANNPSTQPWGKRSQGGNRLWGNDYDSNWNNNSFIMIQIESMAGTSQIEYILQYVPGIDAVMIASSDFGMQEGDRDGSPSYNAREEIVRKAVLAHGKTLVGPSSWYGRPGYQMYQGMRPAQPTGQGAAPREN